MSILHVLLYALLLLAPACRTLEPVGDPHLMMASDAPAQAEGNSGTPMALPNAFKEIWNDALPVMEKALDIRAKMGEAPDAALFGPDRKSLEKDFNGILDDLMESLSQGELDDFRNEWRRVGEQIRDLRQQLASYHEEKAGAPEKHLIKTTKAAYDKKIADTKDEIRKAQARRENLKKQFVATVRGYGVEISEQESDLLLARIDSDDILRMAAVFDAARAVSGQLAELTRQSGEELTLARRYYGMHVVLLEMVLHMQERYLSHIDERYLPRLMEVRERAIRVKSEALAEIRAERSPERKRIYRANVKSHELTIKAGDLYRQVLTAQRGKVSAARDQVARDLTLARNTLETVVVSADLLDILKNSVQGFEAVMNLQVPELVPFENLHMKQKFEELTAILAGEG